MIEQDILDALWDELQKELPERVFISRETFERGLDAWEIDHRRDENGKLTFLSLTKGPEFHFVTLAGVTISRTLIATVLRPIFEKHGYVTTTTPIDEERQHRFNKVMGFVEMGRDEFFVHYRMERLRVDRACR